MSLLVSELCIYCSIEVTQQNYLDNAIVETFLNTVLSIFPHEHIVFIRRFMSIAEPGKYSMWTNT